MCVRMCIGHTSSFLLPDVILYVSMYMCVWVESNFHTIQIWTWCSHRPRASISRLSRAKSASHKVGSSAQLKLVVVVRGTINIERPVFRRSLDFTELTVGPRSHSSHSTWRIPIKSTFCDCVWVQVCQWLWQCESQSFQSCLRRSDKKNLLLVKMKEKKLLKMQSLPKVLRSQAMRSTTYKNFVITGQKL